MQSFVVGNVTIDTTVVIADFPEPGVSIHGREAAIGLGGKGCNQAIVMARAGVKTRLVAAVGDDARGATISQLLADEPLIADLVVLPEAASDASLILSAHGENANITTSASAEGMTLERATAAMETAQPGDLLVLQGNLTDAVTAGLLAFGKTRGMVTAFNPSPLRPGMGAMLDNVDVLFLNESETSALTGKTGKDAAEMLLARGPEAVVLTLGGAGAMLVTAAGVETVPPVPCTVVDTTGAGDTFMATALSSAALRGERIDRRAMLDASHASALTVSRMGTQAAFPTENELTRILGQS